MTIAELIFEQVKKLPDQAAREVLDFVGYLRDRGERAEARDLMAAQSASLALVWDNSEDQVWDNVERVATHYLKFRANREYRSVKEPSVQFCTHR